MATKRKTETAPPPVLVVTGATGGIGSAIAERAAQSGYALYLHGWSRFDLLVALAGRLKEYGVPVKTFQYDLADPERQDRLIDDVLDSLKKRDRLAGWVNAAGLDLMTPGQRAKTFDERLDSLLALDVTATIRMSRRIGHFMRDKAWEPRPLILSFGWDGIQRGAAGDSSMLYAAAKGAVVAFSKALARELAPHVRVCSISPGWIKTTWGGSASPAADARAKSDSLLDRWGKPEEIANAALFLFERDSEFVNGTDLVVNGGFRN